MKNKSVPYGLKGQKKIAKKIQLRGRCKKKQKKITNVSLYVQPKIMLKFPDWSSLSPSQKVKVHGPRKLILGHFNDFGHFPIEIPIEVKKNY